MTDSGLRRWVAIGFVSIVMLSASPVLAADSVRSEIEAANKVFEAAVSRSDGPGVAALYTDNAQLLPAQSGFVARILQFLRPNEDGQQHRHEDDGNPQRSPQATHVQRLPADGKCFLPPATFCQRR